MQASIKGLNSKSRAKKIDIYNKDVELEGLKDRLLSRLTSKVIKNNLWFYKGYPKGGDN